MSAAPPSSRDRLERRAQAIVAHAEVTLRGAPAVAGAREPSDLAALFAVTDGLELRDGTRILKRAEIRGATAWLVTERSLEWGDDLWVIGERDDLVIVRDLDTANVRASGGVVEAPTDGLSRLTREAPDLISYLEGRLGLDGSDTAISPERAARDAARAGDADALARAIEHAFYPGAGRELAHAALVLGGLRARAGDPRALAAFTMSVTARARAAARGAEETETRAGWRACAVAAERAGAAALADECRARAGG